MDRFCDTFESWEECAFLEDYIQGDPYGIMDISSIIKNNYYITYVPNTTIAFMQNHEIEIADVYYLKARWILFFYSGYLGNSQKNSYILSLIYR